MCLRWIRQKAKKIKPKDRSNERVEVIEMDELFSFKEEKTPIYIMTLVNRKTREILGYDIARDRSLQRIQNLVDNAPKAEFYFSDAFPVYSQICYDELYRSLNNKSQTFTVESVNADLRHYIPLLHHKSRCFFRSFDTIFAVFKIFVLAFNKFFSS